MRPDRPVTLKIGYKEYKVSFVNKFTDGDHVGECINPSSHDYSKGRIRIKKGQQNVEKLNTVIHEILHAIWYTQGLQMSEKAEETAVNAIANGLSQFIKDNPRFFAKLVKYFSD